MASTINPTAASHPVIFTRQSCPPVSSLATALAKAGCGRKKLDHDAFFLAGRNEYW
jgi:hypothetical protein